MTRNSSILFVFVLVSLGASARGQSAQTVEWQKITSSTGELSVTVPAGFQVYKEARWSRWEIAGAAGGASFEVTMRKTSTGIATLVRIDNTPVKKGVETSYIVGESRVSLYTYQGSKIFRVAISTGTKKGFYRIALAASSQDNETLRAILASIQLDGKAIVKGSKVDAPVASSVTAVDSLKDSDLVRAALKRKQTEPIQVEAGRSPSEPDRELIYSRPFMILSTVPAKYSDRARRENISGSVLLRVLFKGNGNIGRVIYIKGLPAGLNEQALAAVKQLKFVPAEVDGRPADVERTIEYTFSIY